MTEPDLPSPIDLCDPADAREWDRTAQDRPGRAEMFRAFRRELSRLGAHDLAVLDVGSGPGFLAAYLLDVLPDLRLTLLDASAPMHDLVRTRLGGRAARVTFVRRSFKAPVWSLGLGRFDVVMTNQAVHELRHTRHATPFHEAVKELLMPGAPYLVSDHVFGDGGLANGQLYEAAERRSLNAECPMQNSERARFIQPSALGILHCRLQGLFSSTCYITVAEQQDALRNAGFEDMQQVAAAGSLVMHRAT